MGNFKSLITRRAPVALWQLFLLALLAGCAAHAVPPDLPEPVDADQLLNSVRCDAHMLDPWRSTVARQLAGYVKFPDTVFLDGRREAGEKISGIIVAVRLRGSSEIHRVETDSNGHFRFEDLPEGVYEFLACQIGFDPDRGWVEISKRASVEEMVLVIRLG